MSYQKYYPNGWQNGNAGNTPITAEALNHMENGLQEFSSVAEHTLLAVEFPSFSSLPQTINSDLITEDHELVRYELGSDGAWVNGTVTTTNGSVTVSGTMSGTTTLKLILGIPEHI